MADISYINDDYDCMSQLAENPLDLIALDSLFLMDATAGLNDATTASKFAGNANSFAHRSA